MITPNIGIYEKALPNLPDWSARLGAAAEAGYGFIELAVDEDSDRISRLDWPESARTELRKRAEAAGVSIDTVILSVHRRYPLGSSSSDTRRKANAQFEKAIALARDIGAKTVQVAGYFVYYEDHTERAREWFLEGLRKGADLAGQAGIMLGLETMDGEDVTSVTQAMDVIAAINSPVLQIYPDIGNLAANGLDVCRELSAGRGHLIGIHLKDARPGEYRRVPFGNGIVPFADAFRTLKEIGYDGNFLIEMWNDREDDALSVIRGAREWILERMTEADFGIDG
ncbi:MAG: L-ribulose-5-phosphate 3-epimerase [Rhodospirillales bacterium]|nr:L-ribulose-5-phosphate 3-epimerase [Rhodospirillales bacterium]